MARGRMIAATLGSSRKFAELPGKAGKLGEFAQALFPLLVAHADDFGRLSGDAFSVKYAIFPTSSRTEAEFEAALAAMTDVGLVSRYHADGNGLVIQVEQWDRHQLGLHKRTKSRFPDPPAFREIPGNSGNPPEVPRQENRTEENRTEGKGTEVLAADAAEGRFDRFWEAYPKKAAKPAAHKAFRALKVSDPLLEIMLAAISRQSRSEGWRKERGKFIPYPATWLRNARWDDEADAGAQDDPGGRPDYDDRWWYECQHEPKCSTAFQHGQRKAIDQMRAEERKAAS